MSDAAKSRVRLWLRAEQAAGLKSVRAPRAKEVTAGTPVVAFENEAEPVKRPPPATDAKALVSAKSPAPTAASAQASLYVNSASQGPFETPELSPADKRIRLLAMHDKEVRGCIKCRLCETRTNTVFGEGDPNARLFFIGEGPGENEDLSGRPFVGKAGQLLDKMIIAMGLKREQVFIANIVKCRPPNNRVPAPDEVATCTPYLQRQLEIVRPQVILTLGLPSAKYMLQTNSTMGRLRGQWQEWRGIKLMPTFHPAYVLRQYTAETRAAVWSDLQLVMHELGLSAPRGKKLDE